MLQVNGNLTEEPVDDRPPLLGSPEQVADDLERAAELGVQHVYWISGAGDPAAQLPLLARLRAG
jgi:alkanesulfonate monooxygenase SsuD/methylene tetrahydromethanopterin reductase-like flavin-dependent oxidoreductase (luciferase family)